MVFRSQDSGLGLSYGAVPGPSSGRVVGAMYPDGFAPRNLSASRSKYGHAQSNNKKKWTKNFVRRNESAWNQGVAGANGALSYEPPRIRELRRENRLKARRYFPKTKKRAPRAPRNTTSFIMRAKKSGGLASLVSPATPAVLSTPFLSPAPRYREGIVDEVKKEWGVDGYGSMNGLIHVRPMEEVDGDDNCASYGSDSDTEEENHADSVQQLEQRLDHDLSRFEIVYPTPSTPPGGSQRLVVRVEELESQVAHLEDENLALKENLYLVQQELQETKRRLQSADSGAQGSDDDAEVCSAGSPGEMSCAT